MSNYLTPNLRALDNDGAPISGAKLYFYVTGTSTPLDTYSDAALSSANANPVVADANGFFDRIYMQNAEYRVVYTDGAASETTFWTEDNVYGSGLLNIDLSVRLKQVASNPLDYGAIGDGVADESTEVQQAVDNATCVVDLLGLTYRCDSQITMSSGLKMINGTLDFRSCADNEYLKIAGTISGGSTTLTAGAARLQTLLVTGDNGSFDAGDILEIYRDGAGSYWNTSSGEICGELHRVESRSGPTFITLQEGIQGDYSATAVVQEIATVDNVGVMNVTILCDDAASGNGKALAIYRATRVDIHNVSIDSPKGAGIEILQSLDVTVRDCFVEDGAAASYGIAVSDGSREVTVRGCEIRDVGTGIDVGTIVTNTRQTRYIDVESCRVYDTGTNSYTTGSSAEYVTFTNCFAANGAGTEFYSLGSNCTFKGCSTRAGSTTDEISFELDPQMQLRSIEYLRILDCDIREGADGVGAIKVNMDAPTLDVKSVEISRNTINVGDAATGIILDATASPPDVKNLSIRNNTIREDSFSGSASKGIDIGPTNQFVADNVSVTGNTVTVSDRSITGDIDNNHLVVSGNLCTDEIHFTGLLPASTVTGNVASATDTAAIYISTSQTQARATVSGNDVSGTISYSGIHLNFTNSASNQVAIVSGNNAFQAVKCILVDGYAARVAVNGNCVQPLATTSGYYGISFEGSAASAITYAVVSGNVVHQGEYNLNASNTANALHDGNILEGSGTAETNGTWTAGDKI